MDHIAAKSAIIDTSHTAKGGFEAGKTLVVNGDHNNITYNCHFSNTNSITNSSGGRCLGWPATCGR